MRLHQEPCANYCHLLVQAACPAVPPGIEVEEEEEEEEEDRDK